MKEKRRGEHTTVPARARSTLLALGAANERPVQPTRIAHETTKMDIPAFTRFSFFSMGCSWCWSLDDPAAVRATPVTTGM